MNFSVYFHSAETRTNTTGFFIALGLHLILISTVIIVFQPISEKEARDITFLGAILDPFEVEKMVSQDFSSKAKLSPIPIANNHQEINGRRITALDKPELTHALKHQRKTTHKMQAAPVDNARVEPADHSSQGPRNEPQLQYQPLRLPQ